MTNSTLPKTYRQLPTYCQGHEIEFCAPVSVVERGAPGLNLEYYGDFVKVGEINGDPVLVRKHDSAHYPDMFIVSCESTSDGRWQARVHQCTTTTTWAWSKPMGEPTSFAGAREDQGLILRALGGDADASRMMWAK